MGSIEGEDASAVVEEDVFYEAVLTCNGGVWVNADGDYMVGFFRVDLGVGGWRGGNGTEDRGDVLVFIGDGTHLQDRVVDGGQTEECLRRD
jgi:hypothetical protein